ncbi:MAG: ABC transporter permease [Ignavibacteriae bacterium]|nr:ABC transporter permease [Ignavibacteriota bacterium]MCB0751134.1 ABC transporter permease [Ignavibacteriota bacterium]MCB9250497.1 ABC transporter permease [Ignavibacteriales bacterium]
MEILKVALQGLKSNKLRSFLTVLGIIVGIFSIISISTILSMLQNTIESNVNSGFSANTFKITRLPATIMGEDEWNRVKKRKDITIDEYEMLKSKLENEFQFIGAEQSVWGKIFKYENKKTNPDIGFTGATTEYFPNNQLVIANGRDFNNQDFQRYAKVIVLGDALAKFLFDERDPVGEEITVDGHKLKVIGVLEKRGDMFGQSRDNFAVTPLTTFQNMFGKRARSLNIAIGLYNSSDYENMVEKAKGYFRTIRKVQAGQDEDFSIISGESILADLDNMTRGIRIGAYVIALIALLAAGVGIMNIMLVSVTERTKEIGIRKAIGAKKKNILMQFLIESTVLSLFGGIIGIIIGLIVGNIAGSALNAKATVPLDWVAIGVLLCVIVGVGFGTYPAYKASNLDPIEALRYE